jgi:hypothetical protein
MRTKQHIEVLLENGIHFNTISKMNKGQIRVLAEKFETNEAFQTQNVPAMKKITGTLDDLKKTGLKVDGEVSIDQNTGLVTAITKEGETTESNELDEKFESKAQQKLFFVKCGDGKTKEQKKWCRLRDEFAKSTTKKQYKKMPEKLHPEKTVKYKKTRTDEDYQQYLENRIFEMIEKHIEPSMTKGELLRTIQERVQKSDSMMLRKPKKMSMFSDEEGNEMKKMKTPIGRLFSIERLEEDTKEKERTKEKDKTKERDRRKGNPFRDPNPDVEEYPKADTKEKERTKERERTKEKGKDKDGNPFLDPNRKVKEYPKAEFKENTKEKEAPTKPGIKTPVRRKNPHKDPAPGVKENPKAETEKQKSDFMTAIMQVLNTK